MTDPGEAASVPGCSGLGFPAGRGLPVRVRSLSSPPPPARLTSLRTRDLTLGGVLKKTKKTFEPNVHAVRKSKDELKEEIRVAPKKERRQRNERRRENRGKRRERPPTIQSHSIFEQGPADTVRKAGWRGATDLQVSTASQTCKLVKKERKEEEEDEDEILNKLQRDDFIDDPGLRNDAKLKPIQLPLCQTLTAATTCEETTSDCCSRPASHGVPWLLTGSSFHQDTRVVVLNPFCAEVFVVLMLAGPENPPPFRPPGLSRAEPPRPEQPSLVELLQDLSLSGREELFFMQLPDTMPGRDAAQKVDPSSEKAAKKEDKRPAHLQAHEGCPVLSQLPEGFLGKLQIRKSGKVELKLGHIVMDVSEGTAFSFLQQLVSVRLSDGRTGDMKVLGNVHHKLVLSPDFQALLRQTAPQQQGP